MDKKIIIFNTLEEQKHIDKLIAILRGKNKEGIRAMKSKKENVIFNRT